MRRYRHSITKLADLHLVSTAQAGDYVIRMGEEPQTVFVTGCPSIDLAAEILSDPKLDFDPIERYGGVGAHLDLSGGYIVVLQHPVTTEHQLARAQIRRRLPPFSRPRCRRCGSGQTSTPAPTARRLAIRAFRERERTAKMHFFKNMHPPDFLRLLYGSRGIVGNSSVAIRECSFLGVPAVNVGSRQTGRERGMNVIDVGYTRHEILAALAKHQQNDAPMRTELYGDGRAGQRIAATLATATLRCDKRLAYYTDEDGRGDSPRMDPIAASGAARIPVSNGCSDRDARAYSQGRVVAVGLIPARGGSKGIPRKNLALVAGKPLLAWTADSALAARGLNAVILSTDDDEIAEAGRACGLEVPFRRPSALASDTAASIDVLLHAVEWLDREGRRADVIVLLQPTAPLRTSDDIDTALKLLNDTHADSVVSVAEVPAHYSPDWQLHRATSGELRLRGDRPLAEIVPRRQLLPTTFYRNGAVYAVRRDILVSQRSLYGDRCVGYVMPAERSVNVDTLDDLAEADRLLLRRHS